MLIPYQDAPHLPRTCKLPAHGAGDSPRMLPRLLRPGKPIRLLFAVGLLTSWVGCGRDPLGRPPAIELPPVSVQLATARLQSAPAMIETTGTVRPVQRAVLAAKVMGVIEELPITLGQPVRAGEVLARISAAELSARLLQAQSQLNLVRRDLARERELLLKGATTAETVNTLEDRLTLNGAMVREAEIMLGYSQLRAPFDGVIARRVANVGDLATPGQPLLEVEGVNSFEIETEIPDSLAGALAVGTTVAIEIPAAHRRFEATVSELSSAADLVARTVTAKIAVPPQTGARSGQYARVQIPGAPAPVLLIPAAAVSPFGQLERVFVAVNGRAQLRLVKTGAIRGDRIEVQAGIQDSEQVIMNPPPDLRDGQRLEAQP